ncbi:TIGR04255 family protein [Pseudomonas syringae pv. theae]|uniref:TIGR04255 family protein n=1 Tax=Pseudomonas syringae group TaxID=136849 RepID=UPI0023CBC005|nr:MULTISPECIES: TIGR04255 family protein [Pseudomonas syringae group]MDU8630763.1 TIGR04255 family protein [Pseudomonas syringae group sp. 243L2]GKS05397.1 TIGR04255 family protein [Pseudomonas syringae pv. theae]
MTTRTGVLKNSPLAHVLASVRFAPWPLLAKKIDEIQNDLRDVLPLMHHIVLDSPDTGPQGAAFNHEAWMLMPSDKSYGVQISKDQILIFTKKYKSYADFEDKVKRVVVTLFSYMNFMHVINMGVRFVDHVRPTGTEKPSDYISERFLSHDVGELKASGGRFLSEYDKGGYKLRVNVTCVPGAFSLPEDILSVLVVFNGFDKPFQVEALKVNEFLVDMDAVKITSTAEKMTKEDVIKEMGKLHTVANGFFRHEEVFSDYAFKVWKGES